MKSILRAKLRVASAAFRRLVNQAFAFRRRCGRGSECCARGEFSPRGGLLFFGRDPGRHSWLAYWRGSAWDALTGAWGIAEQALERSAGWTRSTAGGMRRALEMEKATQVSGGPHNDGGGKVSSVRNGSHVRQSAKSLRPRQLLALFRGLLGHNNSSQQINSTRTIPSLVHARLTPKSKRACDRKWAEDKGVRERCPRDLQQESPSPGKHSLARGNYSPHRLSRHARKGKNRAAWDVDGDNGGGDATKTNKKGHPGRSGPRTLAFGAQLEVAEGGLAKGLRAGQLLALLQRFLRHVNSSNWIWFAPMGSGTVVAVHRPNRRQIFHRSIRKTRDLANGGGSAEDGGPCRRGENRSLGRLFPPADASSAPTVAGSLQEHAQGGGNQPNPDSRAIGVADGGRAVWTYRGNKASKFKQKGHPGRSGPRNKAFGARLVRGDVSLAKGLGASQLLALLQRFLRHVNSSNWISFAPTGSGTGIAVNGPNRRQFFQQIGQENTRLSERCRLSGGRWPE